MKKSIILLVAVFILIYSFYSVSAVASDLKDSYQPKETAIGKISGNGLEPILKENIELKRKNVLVPIEYDVKKIGDEWIVWFIAPEGENNYTLYIRDIATTVNGVNQKADYEKNFSVLGQIIEYNVNPGAVFAQDDFSVTVNSFVDDEIDITTNFPSERNIVLKPGANKIDFFIDAVEGNQRVDIGVGKYVIPAYVIGKEGIGDEDDVEIIESRLPEIRFRPRIIQTTILSDQIGSYPFYIINAGDLEEEVEFEYDEAVFEVYPKNKSFVLRSNENREFNLTLKKKLDKNFNSTILAKIGNESIEMPIEILITENIDEIGTPYLKPDYVETKDYTCSELNGIQCDPGEICSNSTISLDGSCCVGVCQEPEETSYSWIGWLIAAVILIILVIIWGRYKKAKGGESFSSTVKSAEKSMP